MTAPVPDLVNHPPHYELNGPPCAGCGRPIQCIEVREAMTANLSDAIKYLWRQGNKDGEDPIKDLNKSVWYIEREIKRLQAGGSTTTDEAPASITVNEMLTGLTDSLNRQR